LPESAERDALELALRVLLGTAWLALGGWPSPEVWNSLHPALPLAKSLKRNDALLPILWGLMMNVMTQGRVTESFRWVKEMLDTATTTGDSDLLIVGHELAGDFFSGRLSKTLDELQRVIGLYDDDKRRHLVELLNHDPKTLTGIYAAVSTWMLGYPDRAVRMQEETIAHAQRLAHPFDLGFAIYLAADVFDCRCEPTNQRKLAEACDQLGRDNSLPVLSVILAGTVHGVALVREGNAADGVGAIGASLNVWEATGGKLHSSYANAVKAEALAQSGDLDHALQVIDEQISQVERPGWGERVFYAEMLRLKGCDHEGARHSTTTGRTTTPRGKRPACSWRTVLQILAEKRVRAVNVCSRGSTSRRKISAFRNAISSSSTVSPTSTYQDRGLPSLPSLQR
jgi:hypothetical protein